MLNRSAVSALVGLALGFTVAGCGSERADAPGTEVIVRDSAGVRISEHPLVTMRDAPLQLTELARIGTAEGEPELHFNGIAGGLILQDGSIVIADRGSSQVRWFADDGSYVRGSSRGGSGPGEYQYIRGASRCVENGFTVFDFDWTMNHYSVDGDLIDTRAILMEDNAGPYNLACRPDGASAVLNWNAEAHRIGFHTAGARLRLLDADGVEIADYGQRIGSERSGDEHGSGPHPAGRSTQIGFLGDDLIVSDGTFFGYERWSDEGRLLEIVRIPRPPVDVDSVMAAYLEMVLASARTDDRRREIRISVQQMGKPEQGSFVSGTLVSGAGVLLQEPDVGENGRWFALDSDGKPVGWLPLPAGAKLLDWTGDFLLVTERDEMDVEQGVLYRAERIDG